MHSLGEPRAVISRDALLHNAAVIRRSLAPGTQICAIVKADAYGHGAGLIADALCNHVDPVTGRAAVDALAVASIDEAVDLPAMHKGGQPVLIFRPVENSFVGLQRSRIETAIRKGWVLTVCSASAADDVARIAMNIQKRANIQVMLDTGMTRSGVDLQALDDVISTILSHPSLRLWGICSHFACSEEIANPFTAEQLKRFNAALHSRACKKLLDGKPIIRHIASSAGLFLMPESQLDMVRPGISLYGIDPTGQPAMERPLRPALTWTAPLLDVRDIRKGVGVGYGQTWHAPRPTRIGLVPIGYGDGYLRCFSNRAVMMVNGHPAPVVGRVSMDSTIIDLGDVPAAMVGDQVTVLDSDPLSPASVYALSRLADTIPYEILCRIGPRVHRVLEVSEPKGHASATEIPEEVS